MDQTTVLCPLSNSRLLKSLKFSKNKINNMKGWEPKRANPHSIFLVKIREKNLQYNFFL